MISFALYFILKIRWLNKSWKVVELKEDNKSNAFDRERKHKNAAENENNDQKLYRFENIKDIHDAIWRKNKIKKS